ncbi:hypothetical protein GCM10020219_071550 [Nonomuraea dietziae]
MGLSRILEHVSKSHEETGDPAVNPEIEYQLMQSHAKELRQAAAMHRRVREAQKSGESERRHRSLFSKFRKS